MNTLIMLVYIDESGDPGMNVEAGASPLFCVTAVTFQNEEDALACGERWDSLRKAAGLKDHVELKFAKSSNKLRTMMLEGIAGSNFLYRSVLIDKQTLGAPIRAKKDSFYDYVVTLTLELWRTHLAGAAVDIDRSGGKDFSRRATRFIAKNFKDKNGNALLKRVRAVDSATSNWIQLADMICGAVVRSHAKSGRQDETFRNLIKARELEVIIRP